MATFREVVDRHPGFLADEEGNFNREAMTASAAILSERTLRDIAITLVKILCRLDALGDDGIHEVIAEHARRVRAAKAKRAKRDRARRAKARAARRK